MAQQYVHNTENRSYGQNRNFVLEMYIRMPLFKPCTFRPNWVEIRLSMHRNDIFVRS